MSEFDIRCIAAGLGMPYEEVAKDLANTDYSTSIPEVEMREPDGNVRRDQD